MLIKEVMKVILNNNSRDVVMEVLDISSPLISSWLSSDDDRIPNFKLAVKIYKEYDLVVYPYNENDLRDKSLEYHHED